MIVGTAARVVEVLQDRLPDLRGGVLAEGAQPIVEHLRSIVEQMREPLETLCSLGRGFHDR
jgi:hypothetical protein